MSQYAVNSGNPTKVDVVLERDVAIGSGVLLVAVVLATVLVAVVPLELETVLEVSVVLIEVLLNEVVTMVVNV
jgi:hypothetical protein